MGIHPSLALFEGASSLTTISSCDHYAGSKRLAEKALALQKTHRGAFDITLDLEDGAEKGKEAELLEEFLQIIRSPENAYRRVGVRIQDFHSPLWRTQIEKIVERVADSISHITIPKTINTEELALMIEHLQKSCDKIGYHAKIPVHVLIESPNAVEEVGKIAALPWIRCLDFGLMDFISSCGGAIASDCMRSPGQFEHALVRRAKTELVAAALAHQLTASHNVTTTYGDAVATRQDAERARKEFGFTRMWSIHPSQISPILEAMSPSSSEIQTAQKVLLAGFAKDWAPISFNQTLHDRASFRYFWSLLKRAHANGMALDPEVAKAFFL